MRLPFFKSAGVAIGLSILAVAACAGDGDGVALGDAQGRAAGYNVLLVTLDTVRADRLGAYGYPRGTTPTLDRLAAEGVRIADAVTTAPVTLPAHASILTGLYPPEHGVRDNGEFRLGAETVTLAETLRDAGYATGAFVSAFVLDARYGLDQGFDRYDDRIAPIGEVGGLVDHVNERGAAGTTDATLDWLSKLAPEAPFFAWVHYYDPHQPYSPPDDVSVAGDRYDAEIAYVDRELGRLLEGLESSGRAGKTLTIVVADHGEGLGEHDEDTHTLLIYESTMRVPLLLHAPGVLSAAQVVEDTVVSVVDVVPTTTALLGLPRGEGLAGVALTERGTDPDRLAYMESLVGWLDHGWAPLHGIRRHRDKLISAPEPEYFDLRADPAETTNLWPDASGTVLAGRDRLDQELTARLDGWPSAAAVATGTRTIDAEERARLESLGYVSGAEGGGDDRLHDPKRMMPLMAKLNRMNALASAGRFEEALAEIDGFETRISESRTLLGQLARIYVRLGRVEEAAAALERYLEIRPSSQALVTLAQVRNAQGKPAEALVLLEQAYALEPRYGAIHITRGDIAMGAGDAEAAREHYLKAGELDPYRAAAAMRSRLQMLRTRAARKAR